MPTIQKKQCVSRDVFDLAHERVRRCYKKFDKLIVAFSGGKDSTAVLNITLNVAKELGRLPLDVWTFDEEAIPPETVEYMERVAQNPDIRFHWYCLPVKHRNACSRESPYWYPWNPEEKHLWVRDLPPSAITLDQVEGFKQGYHTHSNMANLLLGPEHGTVCQMFGIRCDESMTRYWAVASGMGFDSFIKKVPEAWWVHKAYPVYDWHVDDVWRAPHLHGWDYNRAYDKMRAVGLGVQRSRCSPPYGEQPIGRLWSYKQCWPELWDKMVARVPGAATAARYAKTALYGRDIEDMELPPGMTWQRYVSEMTESLEAGQRQEIRKALKHCLKDHRQLLQGKGLPVRPMPDVVDDVHTGYSWKTISLLATNGGNKFGRQTQRIRMYTIRHRIANQKKGLTSPDNEIWTGAV